MAQIQKRCKLRKFNRISRQTNEKIKEFNQNCFDKNLSELAPKIDKD